MILHRLGKNFRILISFLLLFTLFGCKKRDIYPEPKGLFNDFAKLVDPINKNKIESLLFEIKRRTGSDVVVVTVPSLDGEDISTYANELYNRWGIGEKGKDNGVLILLAKKERKARIEVGYGLEGILPDGLCGEILDLYMIPYFRRGDFGKGIYNGVLKIANILSPDIFSEKEVKILKRGEGTVKKPKKTSFISFGLILLIFLLFGFFPFFPFPIFFTGDGFDDDFSGFGGGFSGFGGGASGGGGAWRGF